MSYAALNGGVSYVTGQRWGYNTDAEVVRLDLADHETRLLTADPTTATQQKINDGFGGSHVDGFAIEEITLSTVGTTSDSVANLLPANSVILGVTARITAAIVTATNWKLGDATTSGRFTAANSTLTLGTVESGPSVCVDQTGAAGPRQVAAAKLRITTTGTPSAGKVRVCVHYRTFVAPTS